jgi:ribosomal protein S18 acetylase RimI-like enzyme
VQPDVSPAREEDLDAVLPLFASYQRFYGAAPDERRNREFLARFLGGGDAGLLLVARPAPGGEVVGFANLYWTFESVDALEHVHLNDLFTAGSARGRGVGRALIEACLVVARQRGSRTLTWMTALDNRVAQRLYERTGAERSTWFEYELPTGG